MVIVYFDIVVFVVDSPGCNLFLVLSSFSSEVHDSSHVKNCKLGLDMVFGMESLVSATQVSKVDELGVGRLGNWGDTWDTWDRYVGGRGYWGSCGEGDHVHSPPTEQPHWTL